MSEPKTREVLKWDRCPKCGSENFLVGARHTLCNMCDWKTAEYPYTPEPIKEGSEG